MLRRTKNKRTPKTISPRDHIPKPSKSRTNMPTGKKSVMDSPEKAGEDKRQNCREKEVRKKRLTRHLRLNGQVKTAGLDPLISSAPWKKTRFSCCRWNSLHPQPPSANMGLNLYFPHTEREWRWPVSAELAGGGGGWG